MWLEYKTQKWNQTGQLLHSVPNWITEVEFKALQWSINHVSRNLEYIPNTIIKWYKWEKIESKAERPRQRHKAHTNKWIIGI